MRPVVDIRSNLGIDFAGRLLEFSYEDRDTAKDKVLITLDNEDGELVDWYPPGAMVVVRWGYPGNLTPWRPVQLKRVTGFESLVFEGTSLESVLDRVQRTEAYFGGSYSMIARGIAENTYGFTGRMLHIEDTDETYDCVNQIAETDAVFLKRLASEVGFVFYVDDTGLHFHAPKYDTPPIRTIRYRHAGDADNDVIGEPRIEFDLMRHYRKTKKKELDPTKKQVDEDEVDQTTDPDAKELGAKVTDDVLYDAEYKATATGEAYLDFSFNTERALAVISERAAKSEDPVLQSFAADFKSDPEFQKLVNPALVQQMLVVSEQVMHAGSAKAKKRALAAVKIKVGVDIIGDPSMRAKEVVRFLGLPALLAGNFYAKRVLHKIDDGYVCSCDLRKHNPEKNPKKGKLEDTGGQVNVGTSATGQTKIYKDPDTGLVYEYPPGFVGPIGP